MQPLTVNGPSVASCYCSGTPHTDRCRVLRYADRHRSEFLPFDPPPEPVQPIGPTPEQIRKAQTPQALRVLRMLQAGPCTTGDFLQAGIGRFGARLGELRAVGHQITTTKTHDHGALYRLVESERDEADE